MYATFSTCMTSDVSVVLLHRGCKPAPCAADDVMHECHCPFQVCYRDGTVELVPEPSSSSPRLSQQAQGAGSEWLAAIQPARDRHEQNLEAARDHSGTVVYRSLRHIGPGEHLYVWYSDDLARLADIPVLTPNNIRGRF